MSVPKTIIILGGGVGGVVAARELRKRLPRQHRVVLMGRERSHFFAPSALARRERPSPARGIDAQDRVDVYYTT